MRQLVRTTVCLALCCTFASSVWAAQPDLATADWSVKSPHSLAANPPSNGAVLALLNKVETLPGVDAIYFGICSARFADLRHSVNLSLVISASDGRRCYLSIIDKTSSSFEHYAFNQAGEVEAIQDLTGNGNVELVLNTAPPGDLGHAGPCIPAWPAIFAWTGSDYSDVSNQHKGYYERKLMSLKQQIAAHSAVEEAQSPVAGQTPESAATMIPGPMAGRIDQESSASSDGPSVTAVNNPAASQSPAATPAIKPELYIEGCTEAEAAKMERFLGISQNAGISDALKWANSDHPEKRELAALVLLEIGTPDAIEHLRTLSHDSDERVAELAQIQLDLVRRGPTLLKFEQEDVEQPLAGSRPK